MNWIKNTTELYGTGYIFVLFVRSRCSWTLFYGRRLFTGGRKAWALRCCADTPSFFCLFVFCIFRNVHEPPLASFEWVYIERHGHGCIVGCQSEVSQTQRAYGEVVGGDEVGRHEVIVCIYLSKTHRSTSLSCLLSTYFSLSSLYKVVSSYGASRSGWTLVQFSSRFFGLAIQGHTTAPQLTMKTNAYSAEN